MLASGGLVLLAVVFFFPMVWMVLSSFKTNSEIFTSPFALPRAIDFGRVGRGLGGRQPRPLCAQQRDRHRRVGDPHPGLWLGRGVRVQSLPLPRARRSLMGLFALGLLLPLQSYFIAQSQLFTYLAITDTRLGAHHPVHGDGAAARGLPAQGVPRRPARASCSKRPGSTARATVACSGRWRCRCCGPVSPRWRSSRRSPPGTSSCSRCCTSRTTSSRPSRPGLLAFSSRYVTDYSLLFSALSIVTIPMIVIYVVFNRHIVEGITAGSVK